MEQIALGRGFSRAAAMVVVVGAMVWPSNTIAAEDPAKEPTTDPVPEPTPGSFNLSPPGAVAGQRVRPPPLNVDYLQYGVALDFLFALKPGPVCPANAEVPCILGSGGGLAARAGYRSRGPWYVGGSYSLAKLDTNGLMRVGILQQLNGEMRYLLNLGQRTEPYATSGFGGMVFGNEWGAEALGLTTFAGLGFEVQLSRTTVVGMAATYRPILFFDWTDRAGQHRDTGLAHFWGLSVTMEAREALGSHGLRDR